MKWILVLLASALAVAAPQEAGDVRQIQFESLLIQGQVQRPDIAIVTGDAGTEGDGLLRLRQDFTDLMAMDAGEAVTP
jgi:hypothetical protein